jgi:hypothetical protein
MDTDQWASWLLTRRDGGDGDLRRRHAQALRSYRDGVLDRAAIRPGDVLLDVGTGTGLIGLGERVALTGGELRHGPDEAGDFVLRATLPWTP